MNNYVRLDVYEYKIKIYIHVYNYHDDIYMRVRSGTCGNWVELGWERNWGL